MVGVDRRGNITNKRKISRIGYWAFGVRTHFDIDYRHRPDFGLQADLLLRFAIYEKLSGWIRFHRFLIAADLVSNSGYLLA